MSWTHSSEAVAVGLAVVLLTAIGTAAVLGATAPGTPRDVGNISASGVPETAQVGEEVTITITITDPYEGAPSEWTLRGSTQLRNVSWQLEETFQGDPVRNGEASSGNQTFERTLPLGVEKGDTVTIQLTGTVPPIEEFTYDPHQNFTIARIEQVTGNNAQTLGTWTVEHYTTESREARQAIREAQQAIEKAGGNEEAENSLQDAIAFYEGKQFQRAIDAAKEAQNIAEKAQQSEQTTQLLLYVAIAVVVVAVVAGGVWYWRSQQGPEDRLQ